LVLSTPFRETNIERERERERESERERERESKRKRKFRNKTIEIVSVLPRNSFLPWFV
jgi:hypothetical protein